jgi:hypothetical protein
MKSRMLYLFGDDVQSEAQVLRIGHGHVEIEIRQVHPEEDGAGRADGGVEEQFDGGEVCGRC